MLLLPLLPLFLVIKVLSVPMITMVTSVILWLSFIHVSEVSCSLNISSLVFISYHVSTEACVLPVTVSAEHQLPRHIEYIATMAVHAV